MSPSMRFLLAFLLIYTGFSAACVIGPEKVIADSINGFELKVEESDLCERCTMISATAPKQYRGQPFSHGLFTVSLGNQIVSRSVHSSVNERGVPEFIGIVSSRETIEYELSFEYGTGRCMSFQFNYRGGGDDS